MFSRIGIVVVLFGATLAVTAPTPADAGPPIVYRSASKTVAPGKLGVTVKASCPKKYQVVSGGGEIGNDVRVGSLWGSFPFDNKDRGRTPDDGWAIVANNLSGVKTTARANAVCVRSRTQRYSSSAGSVGDNNDASFGSGCGLGEEVIGGGVRLRTRSPNAHIVASGPSSSTQWTTHFFNASGAEVAIVEHLICTTDALTHVTTSFNIGANAKNGHTLACPASSPLVGGGFLWGGAAPGRDLHLMASVPVLGPDPAITTDDGWRGTGWNSSNSLSQLASVHTICRG